MRTLSSHFRPLQAPFGARHGRGQGILPVFLFILFSAPFLAACSDSGGSGPDVSREASVLTVLEGDGIQAPAGTVVPQGPSVQLLDGEGNPVIGASVQFQVVEGGGEVVETSVRTDGLGRATGIWILGRGAGTTQRLRASHGDLSAELTAQGVAPATGQTYQGKQGYVDYLPGDLPLVLTAPHGGSLEPADIPNRGYGTTVKDRNTRELSLAIREAVFARTGGYLHVIISNLHRRKLDPNREIVEAAQGNPDAERAWWEFQIFADEAGDLVTDAFGEGLHLDIHGHGHDIDRVEIGYLLSRNDLTLGDEALSGTSYVNKSSIRSLASKPGTGLASLVRGTHALGTLMEDSAAPAVPSLNQPNPGQDDYFTGGYNTVRHGSRDGGAIDAIQLEHHFPGLRDEASNRERYAEALARILVDYFQAHYDVELAPRPDLASKSGTENP